MNTGADQWDLPQPVVPVEDRTVTAVPLSRKSSPS